jgi:hypothetical protein
MVQPTTLAHMATAGEHKSQCLPQQNFWKWSRTSMIASECRMHEDLQKWKCFVSYNGEDSHYSQMEGKHDL